MSFTSDLWSDPNLTGYMAVTAHYMKMDENGNLIQHNQLVAFQQVQGSHTGKNLAHYFFQIFKELGVLYKVPFSFCVVFRWTNIFVSAWNGYIRQC